MQQSSSEPCGPDLFNLGITMVGIVLPVFLPDPGLVEEGASEGPVPLCSSLLVFALFWRNTNSCEIFNSSIGKFGKMPDSKPNERRVSLLKEWLQDLLKPGYVNQRIEILKKAIKKQNKDSEARFLFKPTKPSIIQALVQEPFRYRFLDVTSATIAEEQVGILPNPSYEKGFCLTLSR